MGVQHMELPGERARHSLLSGSDSETGSLQGFITASSHIYYFKRLGLSSMKLRTDEEHTEQIKFKKTHKHAYN